MMGIERALELVEEAREHLFAASLDHVVVTIDPLDIPGEIDAGNTAVCVLPPKLSFPNYHRVGFDWTLLVVAGPVQDQIQSWQSIDAVIQALQAPLDLEDAEPVDYAPPNGPQIPAYTITFTETI